VTILSCQLAGIAIGSDVFDDSQPADRLLGNPQLIIAVDASGSTLRL
jgi:hypothetical protein